MVIPKLINLKNSQNYHERQALLEIIEVILFFILENCRQSFRKNIELILQNNCFSRIGR